ncbi:MAG: hypothetical protein H6832_12405 [Planctomycetes bacterium]|nr:hypothetical protein [Planctomycetota bacterium]MCB9891977.1 hypothetical protein [Planctomycetota bacterium]MCB9919194.1 hypothetical protein [Planctomycetota bacterium]
MLTSRKTVSRPLARFRSIAARRVCVSLAVLASVVFTRALHATDYYVDGLRGLDVPTNGTVTQPWRTVAYAMAQAPVPPTSTTHRILVAGSQDYVVDTTIVLRDRIFVVGDQGARPRFVPGGQRTIFRVGSTTTADVYGVDSVLVAGGDVAIDAGTVAGASALQCIVSNSEFRGQTVAAIRANFVGGNAQFYSLRNEFAFTSSGITVDARGRARIDVVVQGSTFLNTANEAIVLVSNTVARTALLADTSRFVFCNRALRCDFAGGTQQRVLIDHCSMRDCYIAAIGLGVPGSVDFEMRDSSIMRSDAGIVIASSEPGGPSRIHLSRNVVDGSKTTGLDCTIDATSTAGKWTATLERNRWQECATNVVVRCRNQAALDLTADRETSARSRGAGIRCELGAGATCAWTNAMVVQNKGQGFEVVGNGSFSASFSTIADHATAAAFDASSASNVRLDHCVFDNAFAPEFKASAGTSLVWSSSKTVSYPGTGNKKLDPALVRPQYKLSPGSPCIDAGDPNLQNPPATDYEGDPRVVRTTAMIADLGADEFRTEGSTRTFGTPGYGDRSGIRPEVDLLFDSARIGTNVPLGLKNARGRTGVPALAAIVVFGLGEAAPIYDFDPVGGSGSMLFFDPLALPTVVPVTTGGTAKDTLPVPNVAGLVGGVFSAQWLVIALDANLQGYVTSDAIRIQVGR